MKLDKEIHRPILKRALEGLTVTWSLKAAPDAFANQTHIMELVSALETAEVSEEEGDDYTTEQEPG